MHAYIVTAQSNLHSLCVAVHVRLFVYFSARCYVLEIAFLVDVGGKYVCTLLITVLLRLVMYEHRKQCYVSTRVFTQAGSISRTQRTIAVAFSRK